MGLDESATAPFSGECTGMLVCPDDLTWLLHKAASRTRAELDRLAAEAGLNDVRDWMVLASLSDGPQCTQLELSRLLGLDKTTLMAMLDRLEQRELIVRTADPADRRVRIPRITVKGRKMQARFAVARDAAEAKLLDGIEPDQRALLVTLLTRIADLQPAN
jgi:MarR family transcriptional regulator, organic hydroperoxide resistance regulator